MRILFQTYDEFHPNYYPKVTLSARINCEDKGTDLLRFLRIASHMNIGYPELIIQREVQALIDDIDAVLVRCREQIGDGSGYNEVFIYQKTQNIVNFPTTSVLSRLGRLQFLAHAFKVEVLPLEKLWDDFKNCMAELMMNDNLVLRAALQFCGHFLVSRT